MFQRVLIYAFTLFLISCNQNSNTVATTDVQRLHSADSLAGRSYFKAHCNTCHAIEKEDGYFNQCVFHEPWNDPQVFYLFVRNPQQAASNEYVKQLLSRYDKQIHPSFPEASADSLRQLYWFLTQLKD